MKPGDTHILRFLSLHNPFYLLSALLMLVACFLIVNPWGFDGRKAGDLFLTWGVLNCYEAAVITMAIVLYRTGRAGKDVGKLVFVSLMFMFDIVLLASAFAIADGWLGTVIVAASALLACAKLAALIIGLRLRIDIPSIAYAGGCVFIIFAAPVVISECVREGRDCETALLYLWIGFTGLTFLFFLWRRIEGNDWRAAVEPDFWRLAVAMSFVMGAAHLVAVGLELQGGVMPAYMAALACLLPLILRYLLPGAFRKRGFRIAVDAIPVTILLLVTSRLLDLSWGYLYDGEQFLYGRLRVEDYFLSYRVTFALAAAVYGVLTLYEKRIGSLLCGTAAVFLATVDSVVVTDWGGYEASSLLAFALALSYGSSILFLRRKDRLSLALLIAGGNVLVTAGLAAFGLASLFVFLQTTGIMLILAEVLVWRNSLPAFRDSLAFGLIAVSLTYMIGRGAVSDHAFAAVETGGMLALALALRFRRLFWISGAGCVAVFLKSFTFVWPETLRGWGILLAAIAAGCLALGFWLSLNHRNVESERVSNTR